MNKPKQWKLELMLIKNRQSWNISIDPKPQKAQQSVIVQGKPLFYGERK